MIIVEIAGHLGADPEVRFAPSGQKITTMRVATNVRRQGKDETVWWRVTVFGDRHDKMLTYLKKGSAIIAIGEMNPPQIWTDKESKQHVQLELVAEMLRFSPFGKSERSAQEGGNAAGQAVRYQSDQAYAEPSFAGYSSSSAAAMSATAPGAMAAGKFDGGYVPFNGNMQDEEHIPF